MKNIILFLFFILPILGCAQYPTTGNKQRLGWQTTGDGLVYRDAGYPSYTPNSRNNAYVYMDTVAKRYYHFSNGAWYDLSDEKYIHRQDQSVLALAVRDSLTTYDRLFIAMEITSAGASDRGVQLPVTAIDSTYAGRVVRVSSLDSSGTYNVFVSSSSPDGLLVDGALATTYYLAADETAEFQLYVFDTIYQWRLVHTNNIEAFPVAPDSGYHVRSNALNEPEWYFPAYRSGDTVAIWNPNAKKLEYVSKTTFLSGIPSGSGTAGTLTKWATTTTLGDAAITETATRLATSLPFRLANIATVSLPASPLAGDVVYNPTTGNFTGYYASSWRPLSLWEINAANIGYSAGNVSVGSTSTFTRKLNVFDDLGLAGIPFQYYPVAKFARSSSGFGIEIGYGTRGFSNPGIEVAGSIVAVGSADARLMLGVQNKPSSLYINSLGGVSLGTGADINAHNLAQVYFNLPLAFTTNTTIAASTSSPTIYASNGISNPLSGGSSTGDLVLQSRSISGQNKAIGFVTGFSPVTRMSIDDNKTIISNELRLSILTPVPTRILGADADGDVGQITVGYGLNFASGLLDGDTTELVTPYDLTMAIAGIPNTNFYTADGTFAGNRKVSADNKTLTFANLQSATFNTAGTFTFRDTSLSYVHLVTTRDDNTNNANGDELMRWDMQGRFNGAVGTPVRVQGFYEGDGTTRNGRLDFVVAETAAAGTANLRLIAYGAEKYFIAGDGLALYTSSDFDAVNMLAAGTVGFATLGIDNSDKESIALFEDDKDVILGGYGVGFKLIPDSLAYFLAVTPSGRVGETVPTFFTQTSDATISNTTTETSLTSTGVGTKTIPVNYFQAGQTYIVRARGYFSTSGSTPNLTFDVEIGGVDVATSNTFALQDMGGSDETWELQFEFTVRTTGASGTAIGQGDFKYCPVHLNCRTVDLLNTSAFTLDTTIGNSIDLTAEWGTASTDNYIVCTNFIIEAKN